MVSKIEVIPNNELDALILSFGNNVEVLSPADYRDHIKEIIAKTSKYIQVCKITAHLMLTFASETSEL